MIKFIIYESTIFFEQMVHSKLFSFFFENPVVFLELENKLPNKRHNY